MAIITTRKTEEEFGLLCACLLTGHKSVAAYDINTAFPLYLYPSADELDSAAGRRPNLSPEFLKALATKLQLPQEGQHGLPKGMTPEDIFHYTYAVFHSPAYRTRYSEFLKIDFPRLPLTNSKPLFDSLAQLGAELAALHLMESTKLEEFITEFPAKANNTVEKVHYTDKDKRVWINSTQFFAGVPAAVWTFRIGGYQVCEKWLKDRKGRVLTYNDIQHYQKIVVALKETIRLMAEIDVAIEKHGGWPGAFNTVFEGKHG
jgi:predicted helicase